MKPLAVFLLPSLTGADGVIVVWSGSENRWYVALEDPVIDTGNIISFREAVRDIISENAMALQRNVTFLNGCNY